MKNLPKTLLGFYMRYAFKPFALLVSSCFVLSLVNRVADGVFWPLAQKLIVELFEGSVPQGATVVNFALPVVAVIIGIWLIIDTIQIISNWILGHWMPKVRNRINEILIDYVHGQSMSFYTGRIPGKINSQINYVAGGFDYCIEYRSGLYD
ncbi:MAG: hypothetical protein LBF37_02990 [Rickettsiales bacterium]|jgi:hypothetical protein|nr:hypothetical protein [Rickettsiales bacterium]